jgi:hypothetical protein
MKEAQLDRKEFTGLISRLERATSIAKAGKYALATDYVQGLTSEEIENIFDGIVDVLEPAKTLLYTISENIDCKSNEKVVIK